MRASSILPSNSEKVPSNGTSKNVPPHSSNNADSFYARQRRLEARVQTLETLVSTLRRDFNRIERRQYRNSDSESSPLKPIEGIQGFPDGLFK